ncbi:MAG TPA: T9SS type A sorting domain-containing protein [Bacteroidia bacterium]
MYNDSLYLYGIFFNSTSTQYLAKWDGLNWDTVPQSPNNTVSCFLEKDNHLYIGGGLDHLGNDSTFLLGKYDGISFSALTPYYGSQSGNIITCMAFYQDTLYVGGNFHMMPYKNLSDFAKFDGTDLALVSSDFANLGSSCSIESMVTYKNELYLGGYFKKTDGYAGNYIMKWDGSGFTEVGNGLNERVTCMQVYNNELYVGGSFTQAGSVNSNYIAKWDGTNWHSLTTDTFTGSYPMILSLNFYRDSLIIGGTFTEINGNPHMQRIAKYSQPIMNVKIKSKPDDVFCVYPNPAASTMTIELKSLHTNTSAQIKNSLGQLIQSFTLNGSDNKILVDVNEYPPGVYFILLQNEGKTLVKKFIKK